MMPLTLMLQKERTSSFWKSTFVVKHR